MTLTRTPFLIAGVILLVIVPLMMGGEFSGADGQAAALIESQTPGFTPWANHLWTPPSAEIESLMFALQAALGAGVLGYVLGRYHGRKKADQDQ